MNAACGIAGTDLHDRLEMLEMTANLLDLLPDVGARHRPERHQHRRARGFQDFRDLVRLQQRVDGIGNAGGLGAEQRDERFRQQRQHEAHDVVFADAERMEHVGGLCHPREEVAVGDDERRVGRVGIGQELDRRCSGIVGRAEPDRVIGARRGDAVEIGNLFEGADVGVRGQYGIFVADDAIEQENACHGFCLLPVIPSRPSVGPFYGSKAARMINNRGRASVVSNQKARMRAGWLKIKSESAGVARMERAYFGVAEKRFSNELACTIGCELATPSFVAAAGASESDGFNGGWADACLVSDFGAVAIFADASGCCGSWRLVSLTLGFAEATGWGWGCALAVASAAAPPPILRARLLKKPSSGAAEATCVEEVVEATSGSSGDVTGPRGGLT